jgi:hypothetical protein
MNGQQLDCSFLDTHSQFQLAGTRSTMFSTGLDPITTTESAENIYTTGVHAQDANRDLPIQPSSWSVTAAMVSILQQWTLRKDFERVYGKKMFDSFVAAVDKVRPGSHNSHKCS